MNKKLDTLKLFKATKTGLLTPNGDLIPVQSYQHFEELAKYEEFREKIENFNDRMDDAEYDFISNIPDDEHPAWHNFEIYRSNEKDELRIEILDDAYNLGWGRVGLNKRDGYLELETSKNSIKSLKKHAKDLAEMFDCELRVHEVERFKYV